MGKIENIINAVVMLVVFAAIVFSNTGCGWKKWDVSDETVFRQYLGQKTLKVPMTLRKQREHQYRFVPYAIMPKDYAESIGRTVCKLPVGTIINIISVKMIEVDGSRAIFAIGEVENTTVKSNVNFEIHIGGYSARGAKNIILLRMPWQSKDAPSRRYVPLKNPMPGRDPWAIETNENRPFVPQNDDSGYE